MAKAQYPRQNSFTIIPALKGVVRKFGFQQRPPFSSIESVNLWPSDARTGRRVTSTRPYLEPLDQSPGAGVNLLCRVNGDGTLVPELTFLAARNGVLYKWAGEDTGSFEQVDVGLSPPAISTGRPVYATPFLLKVIIANNGTPLVYNYLSGASPRLTTLTATAGNVPLDCRVVATWEGSVWFGGAPTTPHILYASRTGTETDFNYAALPEDDGGAFATTGSNEGLIGEPIVALMPQTGDTMVVGCVNSMYALHGHPRRGGSISVLSGRIGPMGQGAWCKAPDGTLFMLTKIGMVTLAPTPNAVPSAISRDRIPDQLMGLKYDTLNPVVSMAYDSRWNGVHITIREATFGGDVQPAQAWWYDLEDGGFHEMEFASYPQVMLAFNELDSPTESGVLYGGDGFGGLAQFNTEGTEVFSYNQVIGPVRLSPTATRKNLIQQVKAIFGMPTHLSGVLTVWVGHDGEEAYNNYLTDRAGTSFSVPFDSLAKNGSTLRPRLARHAMLLQLSGATPPMIFEGADVQLVDAGRERSVRQWTTASQVAQPPQVSAGPDQIVDYV
jgi:hypothetical protein